MALKPDTIIILRCGVPSCPNLGTWPCLGGLSFGRDLRRLGKWEWYCGVLGQRTITPVEDEKPLNPGDGAEPLSGGVQPSKHTGFHKDLNSLPKPLSVSDLSSSRNDGIKVQVAYQGVPGSYSEDAALKAYPNCEVVPCDDFEAALKAVELWLVDKAVLPIENSVGGSIHRNYDLLLRHRLHIVGEVQLEVNHCLLGLPGVRKEDMKLVLSHPQALDQCEKTLNKLGVIRISAEDTADCSFRTCERYWSSGKYSGCSYIWPQCSCRKNAVYYKLPNLSIWQRFTILAREPIIPGMDRPYKIESRPQRKRPLRFVDDCNKGSAKYFDNLFYIDFQASMADPRAQFALGHLQEFARYMRILGSYPMDT